MHLRLLVVRLVWYQFLTTIASHASSQTCIHGDIRDEDDIVDDADNDDSGSSDF